MRTALLTGVVGQDGAYLARHLLARGYRVVGTTPPAYTAPAGFEQAYLGGCEIRAVDLADERGMRDLLEELRPEEIYNLASISSVAASWEAPLSVARINGVALLGLLESVRQMRGYEPRICQASSAEIFGTPTIVPTPESHPVAPTNPYATAKAFAHFCAANYRAAYGMFVATVILFNHESPLRPPAFVTRKITAGAAAIAAGRADSLELGRLDVRRDWGAAADFTVAMHSALTHPEPRDYVIATGVSHELGEFVELAFAAAGIADPWRYVRSNPAFIRPTDIPETRGDITRARAELGWAPQTEFEPLVAAMVRVDQARLDGPEHDPGYLDATA